MRLGGEWSRAQAYKNACIRALLRGVLGAVDRIPPRVLRIASRAFGKLIARASACSRGRAERNVRLALGSGDHGTAGESFARALENLSTSLLLRRGSVRALDWVEIPEDVAALFRSVLARGRGAVFVSAHLGPFELLPAAVAELGLRPAIVVRESYDPALDPIVDSHRHTRGVDVIHRGHPGAALRIVRALRAGQPVGFLPDFGGRVPSIRVPFLGANRPFPIGPQQIAQRTGAPILVGALASCSRETGQSPGHRLCLSEVDTEGSLAGITARVAERLGALIVKAPADYPWMAVRS